MDGDGRCLALFFDNFYWKNCYCNKSKDEEKMNTNCKNRIERIQGLRDVIF